MEVAPPVGTLPEYPDTVEEILATQPTRDAAWDSVASGRRYPLCSAHKSDQLTEITGLTTCNLPLPLLSALKSPSVKPQWFKYGEGVHYSWRKRK